ncbi:hypothetical protein [Oceanobacillus polygoni]|uniref:Uncharacterized protein n=1 Tax=Oceanobacillus polygoni TaxID=1235259 RepID=A0A9X1CF45_9BACI|nr:hypothetical protein [Oceanobacillus polygoni]MBP2076602.1 hypothetical protein [Oceanobacillus polygoni]
MSIFVMDCNEWVTYHIVDTLLENDYKVDALSATTNEEDLSMFFARNSSFSIVPEGVQKKYTVGILVGEQKTSAIHQEFDLLIVINPAAGSVRSEIYKKCTVIHTPILFGEWMPMNEKGIYDEDTLIAFESDVFKENALYIGDFTKALLQWLNVSDLPPILNVNHNDNEKDGHSKLEKNVFIRDNIPKQERVKSVIEHYRSKRNFTV